MAEHWINIMTGYMHDGIVIMINLRLNGGYVSYV